MCKCCRILRERAARGIAELHANFPYRFRPRCNHGVGCLQDTLPEWSKGGGPQFHKRELRGLKPYGCRLCEVYTRCLVSSDAQNYQCALIESAMSYYNTLALSQGTGLVICTLQSSRRDAGPMHATCRARECSAAETVQWRHRGLSPGLPAC